MNKIEKLINELCPDGVEFKELWEVCEIKTGKLNANAMVENGKYPFFTCAEKPFKINNFAFNTEAILISGNGSQVGHVNYYKGKFNAYQRTYILDKFNTIDVFYLLHYLNGNLRKHIFEIVKKGSVPYITLPLLKTFQIPIPPLSIQKEIVKILDNFTQLEAELEAELEARGRQYEYYRDEMLSFGEEVEWKELGEVCKLITKGTTPKFFEKNGITFIKTEAFNGCEINKDKLSYITENIHNSDLKRSILQENDILFTIAGATIGKSTIVSKDILPANTNQALAIIRLSEVVENKYIFHLLQSNLMKKYISKNSKGSAQPNLNLQQINNFSCIIKIS